jgi:hypothetical protein
VRRRTPSLPQLHLAVFLAGRTAMAWRTRRYVSYFVQAALSPARVIQQDGDAVPPARGARVRSTVHGWRRYPSSEVIAQSSRGSMRPIRAAGRYLPFPILL